MRSDAAHHRDDFTFVTNNAQDFRKLDAKQDLHTELSTILPQILPRRQRDPFALILSDLAEGDELVNEVIEISLDGDETIINRLHCPKANLDCFFPPIVEMALALR